MNEDDRYRTILGSGLGPWLISDRPKGWEWESFPRRITTVPRYREGPLLPWRSARGIASEGYCLGSRS